MLLVVLKWLSSIGRFHERKNYDYGTNTCMSGMCGHYTQVSGKVNSECLQVYTLNIRT